MIKLSSIPSLTLSGKTCEFFGFLAACAGFQSGRMALLAFGLLLLMPVIWATLKASSQLRGVKLKVRRPLRARACEATPLEVTVEAPREVRGLLIRDHVRPNLGICLHLERVGGSDATRAGGSEIYPRRGRQRANALSLSCSRPLGLARAERIEPSLDDILVLPAIGTLHGSLRELAGGDRRRRVSPEAVRGEQGDTRALRPFVAGDSRRHIHWKSSARIGELMVRELEDERGDRLIIALGGRTEGTALENRLMESAVSLTASLLQAAARGYRSVMLLLPKRPTFTIVRGNREQLLAAEAELAILESSPGWPDWSEATALSEGAACLLIYPGTSPPPPVPANVRIIDMADSLRRGEFRAPSVVPT